MGRIHRADLDHGRGQEPLDVAHRGYEPPPLASGERAQEGLGQLVASLVELPALG
jgi:hypothetical protein